MGEWLGFRPSPLEDILLPHGGGASLTGAETHVRLASKSHCSSCNWGACLCGRGLPICSSCASVGWFLPA